MLLDTFETIDIPSRQSAERDYNVKIFSVQGLSVRFVEIRRPNRISPYLFVLPFELDCAWNPFCLLMVYILESGYFDSPADGQFLEKLWRKLCPLNGPWSPTTLLFTIELNQQVVCFRESFVNIDDKLIMAIMNYPGPLEARLLRCYNDMMEGGPIGSVRMERQEVIAR